MSQVPDWYVQLSTGHLLPVVLRSPQSECSRLKLVSVTYPHLTFSSHVLSWSKQHGSCVHLVFISSHLTAIFPTLSPSSNVFLSESPQSHPPCSCHTDTSKRQIGLHCIPIYNPSKTFWCLLQLARSLKIWVTPTFPAISPTCLHMLS